MNTVEVLVVENILLPSGFRKWKAFSGHHQTHVGGGRDYEEERTTVDMMYTVMNCQTNADRMAGCREACRYWRCQGRLMKRSLSWYKIHVGNHVGTFIGD